MTNYATREEALTALWKDRTTFEKEDRLEDFEKLEKEIKSTPILNLTVAVDFSLGEIEDILQKVKTLFDKNVFLNLRVDPGLIGGCILVWNGTVHDYSLKKTIMEKRGEFKKLLNEKWK